MKCDDLQRYTLDVDFEENAFAVPDDKGTYMDASEVDSAIAELKAENRRLKRALWLARALRARDIQRWWISATCAKITERACSVWNNVELKCRSKADKFKDKEA